MHKIYLFAALAASFSIIACQPAGQPGGGDGGSGDPPSAEETIMWINNLDLLPGDASVVTSFNATSSGVGGGLSGLIIESTTLGDVGSSGGNKVVEKGVPVPPGYQVTGVRTCYELADARSFITQVRLAQVQDPPASAVVKLDDGTDLTNPGPLCVDSSATSIDASSGGLLLSLRVDFGDLGDRIVLRGLGLRLKAK